MLPRHSNCDWAMMDVWFHITTTLTQQSSASDEIVLFLSRICALPTIGQVSLLNPSILPWMIFMVMFSKYPVISLRYSLEACNWLSYVAPNITPSHSQPMIFSWINIVLSYNHMKRSHVVVWTNTPPWYHTEALIPMLRTLQNDTPRPARLYLYALPRCTRFRFYSTDDVLMIQWWEKIQSHWGTRWETK